MATRSEGRAPVALDPIRARDDLVGEIVDEITSQGYYLRHVDVQPAQSMIDLRWAAHLAGRRLDRTTCTYASAVGAHVRGKVTAIVAPIDARNVTDIPVLDRTRAAVKGLLAVHNRGAGRNTA